MQNISDRQATQLRELRRQVVTNTKDGPLLEVGVRISDSIDSFLQCPPQPDLRSKIEKPISYFRAIIQGLPTTFGPRFWLDAGLIQAATGELDSGGKTLSHMIIPRYGAGWYHYTVPIPSHDFAHVIDVITLPGEDDLEDVSLLDYPWLWHELAHNLLFKRPANAEAKFGKDLDGVQSQMRIACAADRGTTRDTALRLIDEVGSFWRPVPSHRDWHHELMCDVFVLWTCGPAFLNALHRICASCKLDPFLLEPSNPPYELRVRGLLEAGEYLGWRENTQALEELLSKWDGARHASHEPNRYVALTDRRFVTHSIRRALEAAEELGLPLCSKAKLDSVKVSIQNGRPPDLGVGVPISGWIALQSAGQSAYASWEKGVVAQLAEMFTQ